MKKFISTGFIIVAIILTAQMAIGQDKGVKRTSLSAWDGMIVGGYVDHGSYVNFGGPSIKYLVKPWSLGFGILPTMRIKEDKVAKGSPKNSAITPTAGFGFTFGYKHFIVQVPFYYNAKTATRNGKWNPGLGLGYKF